MPQFKMKPKLVIAIIIQANAGLPKLINGESVFPSHRKRWLIKTPSGLKQGLIAAVQQTSIYVQSGMQLIQSAENKILRKI